MRLIKYAHGWTRRRFMEQVAKGIVAAGVLSPLSEVLSRDGSCAAAYPPELVSIEAYTRGKLKAGDVLHADNVELVRDLLDPVAYWQIKHDHRTVDLIATETEAAKLMPSAWTQATLRNRGLHQIGSDGNVWTRDGKPWIGGNPFPEARTAQELLIASSLCPMYYDATVYAIREWDTDSDGQIGYVYDYLYVQYLTVGRISLEPKPYLPDRETDLRISSMVVTAPQGQAGAGVLEVWPYDQRKFPVAQAYSPTMKRTRTVPVDARFEPAMPGAAYCNSDGSATGDPVYTWGDFKIVGKGPFLAATRGNCHFGYPNWEVPTCGGKTGKKYFRTFMELVPEGYVVEMKPIGYPRCPYSRKRIWFDARTGNAPTFLTYNRQGEPCHQIENLYDFAEKKPGIEWPQGLPDRFWSFMNMHMYDYQSGHMSRMGLVPKISGGFVNKLDDPRCYEEFCNLAAIRRLGR